MATGTTAIMPGCAAGLYVNTATGNTAFGTPTWSEVLDVRDVKVTMAWDFAEARSRATPIKLFAKTGIDLSHQAVLRADPEDQSFALFFGDVALRGATTNSNTTAVEDLLILDGKQNVIGAVGVRGPFLISAPEAPQDIDGVIYYTFDLKPSYDGFGNLPQLAAVTNTNNTITYTTLSY